MMKVARDGLRDLSDWSLHFALSVMASDVVAGLGNIAAIWSTVVANTDNIMGVEQLSKASQDVIETLHFLSCWHLCLIYCLKYKWWMVERGQLFLFSLWNWRLLEGGSHASLSVFGLSIPM